MAMSPFALSLLGAESLNRRRLDDAAVDSSGATAVESAPTPSPTRPLRTSRRATSYHNQFQSVCSSATDDPPPYAFAAKQRAPTGPRNAGTEILPKYSTTVTAEAKLLLHLESTSPLNAISEYDWREVYVILCGTLLSIHRPKDGKPGKLLRSYSLQHAEVGLATDADHSTMVPQTRLAHLIPSGARRRAWQKDPGLFKSVRQHILRLRVETDQLLLADASENRINSLIYAFSAAIDISPAIDERSLPRQCTVPRRRRRPRADPSGDLTDPTLLAEQERIWRDLYPTFAERPVASQPVTPPTDHSPPAESVQTPTREEDDLDFSMIREESTNTPAARPQTPQNEPTTGPITSTETSITTAAPPSGNTAFTADMLYATSAHNFSRSSGKWQPPHLRTPQQVQRYVRRCLPVLLADSPRASDILFSNGKRVKVNWRMQLLEEWELRPPSYKSHGFNDEDPAAADDRVARSVSQFSTAGSAGRGGNAQASCSVLGAGDSSDDQITPAEEVAHLDLAKVTSIGGEGKRSTAVAGKTMDSMPRQQQHRSGADVHGIMFCF